MTGAPFHRCMQCDEVITNPICSECLAAEMKHACGEHNPALADAMEGIAVDGATKCILCHQSMALCAYCFSRDSYELLKERDPALAEEFASQFDFGLRSPGVGII